MTAAEFIAEFLGDKGITDAFGIPGGVILDFLYAMEDSKKIRPHLSYHEQCSVFSACGYAQAGGVAGIAYATRGPGIMNTVTGVADAFCDSVPLIVFTAHEYRIAEGKIRVMNNQEFDLRPVFSGITKYFARVDQIEDVEKVMKKAFHMATSGRKGPVVIDMAAKLWNQEMTVDPKVCGEAEKEDVCKKMKEYACQISESIAKSSRPVVLAGDGIRQSGTEKYLARFVKKNEIPVLTSRYSQDILAGGNLNFGYIGSHAIRSANFILSKADLIIGLGNRMAFPVNSKSFAPVIQNSRIIRVDVDTAEFERDIPGACNLAADLSLLLPSLADMDANYDNKKKWLAVCRTLQESLKSYDIQQPVYVMADILQMADDNLIVTSDVGNNEFWLSRAYTAAGRRSRILYSKTFGALGCSVAKAIGAYYAGGKPVLCFTGDQGLQMNLQELQAIGLEQIPIAVIVINNESSGMIRNSEQRRFHGRFLHTTKRSGYGIAGLPQIAEAYGIEYIFYASLSQEKRKDIFRNITRPMLIEVMIDEESAVTPNLKYGDSCQKLFPYIDEQLFKKMESLQ